MNPPLLAPRAAAGLLASALLLLPVPASALDDDPGGTRPTAADGRPLNLDFEAGDLSDWTADGPAFDRQPVEGDTVAARRSDMKSGHQGRFWVGTFERGGDAPQGTLTSAPFEVTQPWCSFLVAGGTSPETCVELVRVDTGKPFARISGDTTEELKRVAIDLSEHVGKSIKIRLVDGRSDGWGHLNFDDFRLHPQKPAVPLRDVPPPPDVYAHAGLSPKEAARAMSLPPGFSVSLFAGEPDVVQPIAMALDDRGRVWVAEAYSYPHKVAPEEAKDRILIFEDTDQDGHFDKRTVFIERLNLVSGLEVGFGGVWIAAAPEFLFIPDRDGNDIPDGPPEVLLDGWGQHDTHETANSFTWGPDGWLYGCHGVFTHSNVGKPGTPNRDRLPLNAGVWRYHPTKHVFEVFAHGTSNPWGVDFDDKGRCVITACVIPHLYYMIQGGRYQRQAGQHFNKYTYDDIKHIGDHLHYVGANPHGGNGRSDSAGGGHAHSGAMIYQGGTWPEEYRGSLFMNNIHGARLNRDILTPKGSGLVGSHAPDFLLSNDAWSQLLNFRYGPDGNVYMIDWYDKNQCHRTEIDAHDRTNGRIFKVSYGEPKSVTVDLKKLSRFELVPLLSSPNAWYRRHARRILQERGPDAELHKQLTTLVFETVTVPIREGGSLGARPEPARPFKFGDSERLEFLWTLHATGGLDEAQIALALKDESPHVRAWTIQLSCESGEPSSATLAKFAVLAKSDPSPVVRLALASALQRISLEKRWETLAGLVAHAEDADDHNIPLMVWYAAEPLATIDAERALTLAKGSKLPNTLPFMIRRVAAIGTDEAIALLVKAIGGVDDSAVRLTSLTAINEALQGRRGVPMPPAWPGVYGGLMADPDGAVRSQAVALGTTFGDTRAMAVMRSVLTDPNAPAERRSEAMAALLKARDADLPAVLRDIASHSGPLRIQAIRGLAAFDDPKTAGALLGLYPGLAADERRAALFSLAARPSSAMAMLDAVAAGTIARNDMTADVVRNLGFLKDEAINARIEEVWGRVRTSSSPAKAQVEITRYLRLFDKRVMPEPDLMLGRAVYARTCGQCHKLFGTGGEVGPELTGSNRADLNYILTNVMDPSALVGKDYQATVIATVDGRVLTGIVKAEDDDAVTLQTADETVVLPKGDIEERKLTEQSLMPEDQWANLSPEEISSLVAYLASPGQVPFLASPETAATLFNGRDLTGWQGNPDLWSIEDGEIVGRTTGLGHNEFLRSDLAAEDFRLRVLVKLVDDAGNSGIQFRSEALPDGEMKGDQADVGPGWWGKLYEENGRGLLWEKSGEPYVKKGEWNLYEIEAIGSKVVTKINGQVCVELDDPQGARRGIFALQLHSGGPTEVRFKDLSLEVIAAEPTAKAAE